MVTLKINDKEATVPEGTNIIEAAKSIGIEIPHYCYHPDLCITGNCRMCLVELKNVPKLQTACSTVVSNGMEVCTDTPVVQEAVRGVLEFTLINHPIDCPICDQAGECGLQTYYMKYGLYPSRFKLEDKVHKPKVVDIGPIMLDAERCILCTRCVRFCEEIDHSNEMVIFNRGDRSEVGTYQNKKLTSKYAWNLIDICPVGALTSKDFRFKCRVWYLKEGPSICPGCSTGCNIFVHFKEKNVYRLKPRFNPECNGRWMCDEGRITYKQVNAETRIMSPLVQENGEWHEIGWNDAIERVSFRLKEIIKSHGPESVAGIGSAQSTNEANFLFKRLIREVIGSNHVDFRIEPDVKGYKDDFLINEDKNPNTRGAADMGLVSSVPGLDVKGMVNAIEQGKLKALYIMGNDLFQSDIDESLLDRAFKKLDFLVAQFPNRNRTTEYASIILPSSTFAEIDGTWTNFKGRVQRLYKVIESLGNSKADWEILQDIIKGFGISLNYKSSEEVFCDIAKSVTLYKDLDYAKIGETGIQY